MADISVTRDVYMDDTDEGVFEQGDSSTGSPSEDEGLPPLSLVQKYAQSGNVYDRQMVTRIVQEIFQTAAVDVLTQDMTDIMQIVKNLGEKDEAMVKVDLLEQIPHLASQAIEYSNRVECLKNVIGEYLIPLVVRNLGSSDNTVDKAAHIALLHLMEQGLITRPQAEIQVCPAILALLHEEQTADVNTGAISLMSKMAPLLGRDVTERVFLSRFAELCFLHMFYVRKVCASHIGDFCAVVGKDQFEKVLLPCYIALCQDAIWGVRKACAEVIMFVSSVCPAETRRTKLAPVFAKLLQDDSKWVQMSAFQNLGPFIATFADPPITNIAYNSQGELVFVNNDGIEFLVDSSARVVRFCKFLTKQPSLTDRYIDKNRDSEFHMEEYWNYDDKNEDNIEIGGVNNATIGLLGDDSCNSDSTNNINNTNTSSSGTTDNCNSIITEEMGTSSLGPPSDELIKEIVESVKNAVLCYRNVEQETGVIGDNLRNNTNVISDIKNETCCDNNLDSASNYFSDEINYPSLSSLASLPPPLPPPPLISTTQAPLQTSNLNKNSITSNSNILINNNGGGTGATTATSGLRNSDEENSVIKKDENDSMAHNMDINQVNNESEKDDDNLQLFNSYNYWYISPDMPLDLSIIEGEPSSKGKLDDSSSVVTFLEDLYANIKLNEDQNSEDDSCEKKRDEEDEISQMVENMPGQDIVPQVLITNFLLMTEIKLSINIDNEMSYHCAYSLPAVALTLKDKNWPLLKKTIERLASNMQYKVRRTVASSLHELAEILGKEIATEHLTPIFEGFIKDLDEVRIGILKNLACFFKLIDQEKRNSYLPRLQDFLQTENVSNWRFRYELANQLRLIITLFTPQDVAKHIGLLAEILLHDVSAVREAAILLISELLRHISTRPGLNSLFLVRLVEKFAHSKRWKRRQTFALLCWKLLLCDVLPNEQFAAEIMPHLLDLSWDPVANVRLVVAKTIAQQIIPNVYFADPNNQHFDSLGTVIRRLQADKDRDVRQHAEINGGLTALSSLCRANCHF